MWGMQCALAGAAAHTMIKIFSLERFRMGACACSHIRPSCGQLWFRWAIGVHNLVVPGHKALADPPLAQGARCGRLWLAAKISPADPPFRCSLRLRASLSLSCQIGRVPA